MSKKTHKVTFEGAHGQPLDARLDTPDTPAVGCVLCAHCFSCSKDLFALSRISRHLVERGLAVFRFDFTGLGHSGGEFKNTNFSSNVADLVAAADFLEAEYEPASLLVGHSLGGTAVLKAAAQIPRAEAVCTIGAPFGPAHVQGLFSGDISEIEQHGSASVTLGGRSFVVERQFLEDIRSTEMESALDELDRPLLIFHSPHDEVVGVDNARRLYEAVNHPKSFISLDGADHLLTGKRDPQYVAETLAAWATRYVDYRDGTVDGDQLDEMDDLRADQVLVAETGEGKFMNDLVVGRHRFYADEPVEAGGNDAGPDPYDLLAAALGACTSMTLRMYADRKEWPLGRIEVRVDHEKVHAGDCDRCERDAGKIDKLTRQITVQADLDDDRHKRLLAIADRCPVHETLRRKNIIESTLNASDGRVTRKTTHNGEKHAGD